MCRPKFFIFRAWDIGQCRKIIPTEISCVLCIKQAKQDTRASMLASKHASKASCGSKASSQASKPSSRQQRQANKETRKHASKQATQSKETQQASNR